MCLAPQRRALFRHLNVQKRSEPLMFLPCWLRNVLRATMACTFSTLQLPKVVREWCVLYILTSKCASRHNGVHFFDISTSKSGPRMVCFVHFDFEMCFAPRRRALFRNLNFQKRSENAETNPFARNEVRVSKTDVFFRIWLVRRQPFRTKWGPSVKNWIFFASLVGPAATISHETRFECQKLMVFCEFGWSGGNHFARNEAPVSKAAFFCDFISSATTLLHEVMFQCQNLIFFCDLTSSAATLSSVKNWWFFRPSLVRR